MDSANRSSSFLVRHHKLLTHYYSAGIKRATRRIPVFLHGRRRRLLYLVLPTSSLMYSYRTCLCTSTQPGQGRRRARSIVEVTAGRRQSKVRPGGRSCSSSMISLVMLLNVVVVRETMDRRSKRCWWDVGSTACVRCRDTKSSDSACGPQEEGRSVTRINLEVMTIEILRG